jgi:hypothetical protein
MFMIEYHPIIAKPLARNHDHRLTVLDCTEGVYSLLLGGRRHIDINLILTDLKAELNRINAQFADTPPLGCCSANMAE